MSATEPVEIAIIGCGFVADYYLKTRDSHKEFNIVGAYDRNTTRLRTFCDNFNLTQYSSIDELLNDKKIDIVLNLTNPRSHYEISELCLNASKHVYSEKPLAMSYEEAKNLVDHAKDKKLKISSAPCSVLSKAAKTLSYAVRKKIAGDIKLVYAELDDGMVHKMAYAKWLSTTGAPWPYRDEFEVGCTLEHAGYYLSWLLEMFGPVKSVTAFSDCVITQKVRTDESLQPPDTADASFGVLKFESSIVVRLSTTIVAPHNHSIRLFGDKGVLTLDECWDNNSPTYFRKWMQIRRKTFLSPFKKKVVMPQDIKAIKTGRGHIKMDFLLGVQELVESVRSGKDGQLSADFSLHVNEIALALQYAGTDSGTYITKSRF